MQKVNPERRSLLLLSIHCAAQGELVKICCIDPLLWRLWSRQQAQPCRPQITLAMLRKLLADPLLPCELSCCRACGHNKAQ